MLSKKGNLWNFGCKGHIGGDWDIGLVNKLKIAVAKVCALILEYDLTEEIKDKVQGVSSCTGIGTRKEPQRINQFGYEIDPPHVLCNIFVVEKFVNATVSMANVILSVKGKAI